MRPWSRRALEGLPLKLLIIALLLSLTAPAVLSSMESYERSTGRSLLQAEARKMVAALEEVMTAGEGNRRVVVVTLPPDQARYSLALEIGGALDNASSLTVRCLVKDQAFQTLLLDQPPARVTSVNGGALRLEAGEHKVRMEHILSDGRAAIVAEVVP